MDKLPIVSVIITTKNEENNIENCLKSVKRQTYPQDRIEIIVVDNDSTDRTKEIARKYGKVYNKGPERSAQRNFGVKKSKGKYILYLDADMMLSEKVVEECVEKCEKQGIDALYIPERIVGKGFWIKVRDFERSFYNGTCIDAVRFIRKKTFLETGGFDENLTGPEDWDLDRRIKRIGKVGIIKSQLYHNEGKFDLNRYLAKKKYYLKDINKYVNKWGKKDPIVKKQLCVKYRLFDVFIENGKWKKLVSHPILYIGALTLKIVIGYFISNGGLRD